MHSIKQTLQARQRRRRAARATLPWAELEAEASRQGCSPADVFFDRAGRAVPGPPIPDITSPVRDTEQVPGDSAPLTDTRKLLCDVWGRTPAQRTVAYDSWGRRM
jgi:hypothetical protein